MIVLVVLIGGPLICFILTKLGLMPSYGEMKAAERNVEGYGPNYPRR